MTKRVVEKCVMMDSVEISQLYNSRPVKMTIVFVLILLLSGVNETSSANWAQVSGKIQQNTVIPYYPSGDNPHWGPRYGAVTIVKPRTPDGASTPDIGTLFLLGGDTYTKDYTQRDLSPGLQDQNWEHGYKNDVWYFKEANWRMKGDNRLRTPYHQKIPQVNTRLEWKQVTNGQGKHPPPGMTYDEWLKCEPKFFPNRPGKAEDCAGVTTGDKWWSPRRHHGGVWFNGYMYIMGGRAREFVTLADSRSVGGIVGNKVDNVKTEHDQFSPHYQKFVTQREATVLKSDVWRSGDDGKTWELMTPGCKAPQRALVKEGNPHDGKRGPVDKQCTVDDDCYGGMEECFENSCACKTWSPREQFSLAVHSDASGDKYIYLSGGYVSVQLTNCGPYSCGDTDGSSYRQYMNDIWRMNVDGLGTVQWSPLPEPGFEGRGGHQMLIFPYHEGVAALPPAMQPVVQSVESPSFSSGSGSVSPSAAPTLKPSASPTRVPTSQPTEPGEGAPARIWVFGGRGVVDNVQGGKMVYFNDVWVGSTGLNPRWTKLFVNSTRFPSHNMTREPTIFSQPIPWKPRAGHSVTYKPDYSADRRHIIFLHGGYNDENGGTFLDDLWTWEISDPDALWRQDYTPEELFITGTDKNRRIANNTPTVTYVTPDSDLSLLQRYWIPAKPVAKGSRMEQRPYSTPEKIALLNKEGIYSIRDLANIQLYTVLKLRGFDFPQVAKEDRLGFTDICDYRALAIALVEKCTINIPSLYDGEKNLPWNIIPKFGGQPPINDTVAWHGRPNYNFLQGALDDVDVLTETWDGCTYNPKIQGLFGPNVNGLGYVDQVVEVRNPLPILQNLFCRQTPGPRAYHSIQYFNEKVFVIAGKQSEDVFYADAWYRDDMLPQALIKKKPKSRTSDHWFMFTANKDGCFFEYRVWDPYSYKELRPWTPVTGKTSVAWLNWREGGPGNGLYQLYVRAVDPAGNRDEKFEFEVNTYKWYYVSPTPWDIILYCIAGFLFLCIVAYLEYRRRVKKAAMERYAMKRMRRKFKAMQRDINGKAVDWRTLYMEQKASEEVNGMIKSKGKKKKKDRDKNAEKREKEKKKREKEKEMIKKKLKASKDFKDKKAAQVAPIQEAVPIKAGKGKSSKGKGKVAAEDGDDDAELDEMARELDMKKGGKGPKSGLKRNKVAIEAGTPMTDEEKFTLGAKGNGKSTKVMAAQVIEGSTKEIRAGDLASSKNTEGGAKQRKVNKKFKQYELAEQQSMKGTGGGDEDEGIDDEEHKKES